MFETAFLFILILLGAIMVKSEISIKANDKGVAQTVDRVTRNINNAERQIQGFGRGIGGTFSSITGLLGNMEVAAGLAITGIVGGLGLLIKETIDTAEHIEKMSQRVGVSAEDLSTLTYAAELSGTEIGVFEKAIQRASRNIDDASRGIGDGKIAFDELGITVVDLNGDLLDADEVMKDVSDRFETMPDGTKKTALALKIFGRAGADLIPMLNGGSDGLNRMQQEARDLGLEISTNTAKQAADLKDDMLRLNSTFTGIATKLTAATLPALNQFTDFLLKDLIPAVKSARSNLEEWREKDTLGKIVDDVEKFMIETPQRAIGYWSALYGLSDDVAARLELALGMRQFREASYGVKALSDDYSNFWAENILFTNEFSMVLEDTTTKVVGLTEEQIKAAAALEKQWNSTSTSLSNQIELVGLSGSEAELVKIQQKVEALQAKFGERKEITEWQYAMSLSVVGKEFETNITKMVSTNDLSTLAMIKRAEELKEKYNEIPGAITQIEKELYHVMHTSLQPLPAGDGPETVPNQLQGIEFDRSMYDAQILAITDVTDADMASWLLRQQGTVDMFSNMSSASMAFYQLGGKQAKSAFAAYKAFSIGETAISTYAAATAALREPPIGLGPVFGIPLAVSTVALGLANVSRIASMQPGSSGGGGSTGSYSPSIPTGSNYDNSTNNNQMVSITIHSDWRDPDKVLTEDIIPAMEKFVGYGGNIKIGSGINN
jgi:hypothetical protein